MLLEGDQMSRADLLKSLGVRRGHEFKDDRGRVSGSKRRMEDGGGGEWIGCLFLVERG